MNNVFIYFTNGKWMLSYERGRNPLMNFKTKDEALKMADLLSSDNGCHVFMQEQEPGGTYRFKKYARSEV